MATPRAEALRTQVSPLLQQVLQVLSPEQTPDLQQVRRSFTLLCSDGFVENFGPPLLARVAAAAPAGNRG